MTTVTMTQAKTAPAEGEAPALHLVSRARRAAEPGVWRMPS
jgi:hypothetical protein